MKNISQKYISKGEHELLNECREEHFFWLNVDADEYEWSFSDIKVGRSQTYSNLRQNGSKKRIASCFENIKVGDKVVAYETGNIGAITTICKAVNKRKLNNEIIIEFRKETDFENFLNLDEMRANKELEGCKVIRVHRETLIKLEKKHFYIMKRMIEAKNNPIDYNKEFNKAVNESLKLSNEERRNRLGNKENAIPEKIKRVSEEFNRNPDVVAEVLIRARGKCEECGKPAPFNRSSDGTPYLEVHHKIRLSDGGKDTIDNAMAVCPNCHRKLHFG